MDNPKRDRSAFSTGDLAALRWLAVAAGVILAGFAVLGDGDLELLLTAFGLVLAMMVIGPLAIYGLRKWRSGTDDSPK